MKKKLTYYSSFFAAYSQRKRRETYLTWKIFTTITEKEVDDEIIALNTSKSKGPDNIHPRLVKETRRYIKTPITKIFNKSLEDGVLPKDWKKACVTPIYKGKGKANTASNYRPISLTSIICKMLEKIVRRRITAHLNNNNLLSQKQYGFSEKRSTTLQLLNVTDEWSKFIEENKEIHVIFLDFMKAFDKVLHPFKELTVSVTQNGQIVAAW